MNNYTNPYIRLQSYYSWLSSRCSEGLYTGMTILELHKATQVPLTVLRWDIVVMIKWAAKIFAKFSDNSESDCGIENRIYFDLNGRNMNPENEPETDESENEDENSLEGMLGALESGKFSPKLEEMIVQGKLDEIPLYISHSCYSEFDVALSYDETLALNAVLKDLDARPAAMRKDPFFFQIKDSYRAIHNYHELSDRLQLVEDAIENQTSLFMRYQNSKNEIMQFDFQPLKISYDENENLYCILSIHKGAIQVHRFDRILGLWPGHTKVEGGDVSLIENLAPQVWGNCFSEEPEHVKVRFYNEANVWNKVKRDLACRTKGKLYEEDGFLYYEDTVYGISKFRTWVYGFGSSAIVLEPVSLREHIIESLKERKNRTE